MKRVLRLDICDYNNNVLCNIYDSSAQVEGQAHDVFINSERNGWKELSFSLPPTVQTDAGVEPNFRLDYLVADFRIRATDDYETDWYLISEPKITHDKFAKTIDVRAGHISQILKTKNLELEFSDSDGNNIGTAEQLLTTILAGTGWNVGVAADFLEDDKVTVKIRTLKASSKTGALSLITELCELFDAKAVYHGEDRTVDLLPLNPFSEEYTEGIPEEVTAANAIELHYSKNVKSISRTLNTENLVTRLYAQGSYGDTATGICNIQTCSHDEYTFDGLEPNKEYMFHDSTGAVFYFYIPESAETTSVIWSKLDLLSRSYVYDADNELYYEVTKKRRTNVELAELTSDPVSVINYLPFLMSFDYYRKIGLLTDVQMLELAKYQRAIPELYKASQEASQARSEAVLNLSRVAEPRTGFLKLKVDTGNVTNESGHLSLKIDTSVGNNGVIYRSDYDEARRNFFTWYVAGELKENGDPISKLGSILFIIHADGTWNTGYLEKIYNAEGLVADDNDNPTHYYYALTKGGEPERIVLHLDYSGNLIKETDKFYLFCANAMSGMLGVNMSTDEAILQSLQESTTDETVKHPVFFSPSADNSLVSQIPENEYGWLYKCDINAHSGSTAVTQAELYFCSKKNNEASWRKVFTGEELPQFSQVLHGGNYFFHLKAKTLWLGSATEWLKMTTVADERLSRMFSTVLMLCSQRERVYKGWYEKYAREGQLDIGNYAAKVDYDAFMLFSTDQATDETVTIDTTNSLVYQHENDSQSVVSFTTKTYDTVDFPVRNVCAGATFNSGNISTQGVDISNSGYYRTGYIRAYEKTVYKYNVPADTTVYFYDQNKQFLKKQMLSSGTHTFMSPGPSDIPATIEEITSYKAGAYYMRIAVKTDSPSGFLNDTYYVQINDYNQTLIAGDKPYRILTGFTGEGERLGIDHLMPKFASLADDAYYTALNTLLNAQQEIKDANLRLVDVLGDMLRDGYWQDNNYAEGDETRLYKDAMDNLKEISKPETTYDVDFLDLYASNENMGYSITEETDISWPDIRVTDAVHLVDEDLDTSCWAYIDKLNKCYDQPWKTTMEINTKLSLIDQHDFTDVMSHIAQVAKETKSKQSLYQRASALTGSGQLAADRLEGTISAYSNQITGGASNWHTDSNGNIVFVSNDGLSAMMLSGNGLSIASSKDKNGEWIWRTAATGAGIVADAVTTGTLFAALIEAGAITADKLSASVGNELEISSNQALTLFATTDGSRPAGSLVTGKVETDVDGNETYSRVGEGESYIQIAPKTASSEAHIDIVSGGNINIESGSALNMSGAMMSLDADSTMDIAAGGSVYIRTGADGKFVVDSPNFSIDETTNAVTVTGDIYTTGGVIAGFTVGSAGSGASRRDYLYSGTDSMSSNTAGVYIGTDGINLGGHLKVSKDGATALFDGSGLSVDAETGAINVKATSTFTVESGNTLTLSTLGILKIGHNNSLFTISSDQLGGVSQNTDRSYIYNGITGITDTSHNGIYLGTDGIVLGKGKFIVTNAGAVTAKDIAITGGSITITKTVNGTTIIPFSVDSNGNLTSISGTIGGWTIAENRLSSGSTNATRVVLDSGTENEDYAIWAGHATSSSAPFSVKKSGAVYATSGTIGGWTLGTNYLGNASTLSSSNIGIRLGTSNDHVVFFAGADGTGISTAPFKVTYGGALTSTSGTIGGWTISDGLLSSDRTATSSAAYVGLDASDTLYAMPGNSSDKRMFAIWAGGKTPKNAKFSVTKDGVVTIQTLRVNIGSASSPNYQEVSFDQWFSINDVFDDDSPFDISTAMGKLKFQTIKGISKTSTGKVTIYYTNNSGGTSSVGFNTAASVKLTGTWSSYSEAGSTHASVVVTANTPDGVLVDKYTASPELSLTVFDSIRLVSADLKVNSTIYASKSIDISGVYYAGANSVGLDVSWQHSLPYSSGTSNKLTVSTNGRTTTAGATSELTRNWTIAADAGDWPSSITSSSTCPVYARLSGSHYIAKTTVSASAPYAAGKTAGASEYENSLRPIHFKRHSSSDVPSGTWYSIDNSNYDLTYYIKP